MGWFDEQGLPGGSIAPIESGYQPGGGGWGGGRVFTDEEREQKRLEFEQQLAAMGIVLPPPSMEGPSRVRTGDLPTGDMHNPGWGVERPTLPTLDQGGSYPLPTQDFRRGGNPVPAPGPAYMPPPQEGTLGAVGMAPQPMAPRDPRISGGFGSYGGGFGQAPTAALQSTSGYGGGRQLGGFAGGGGSMLRSPTGVSRQVARSDVPFYLQRGATEVR